MEGELLTAVDRSGRGYVFSPTHEEAVTSLVAGLQPISHRQINFDIPKKFKAKTILPTIF
jgi:prolyl-tRNA synthetase